MATDRDYGAELDALADDSAMPGDNLPSTFPGESADAPSFSAPSPARSLIDHAVLRKEVDDFEARGTARKESAKGILGDLGAYDETQTKEWIVGEKAQAEGEANFWDGVIARVVPGARSLGDWHRNKIKETEARGQAWGQDTALGRIAASQEPIDYTSDPDLWFERKAVQNAAEARHRRALAEEMEKGTLAGPKYAQWRATVDDVARGVGTTVASMIKGDAYSGYGVFNENLSDAQKSSFYAIGAYIEESAKSLFPADEARAKEFKTALGEGAGSMFAFFGPALAARAIGLVGNIGAVAMSAVSGSSATAGQMVDEALAKYSATAKKEGRTSLTPEEERNATEVWLLSLGIGATEAAPFLSFLGGHSGRMARRILMQVGEEGGQEALQTLLENAVAKNYYDPDRKWDDNVWTNTAVGGILGAKMQAASEAAGALRRRRPKDDTAGRSEKDESFRPVSDQSVETVRDVSPSLDPDVAPGRTSGVRTPRAPDPVIDEARAVIDGLAPAQPVAAAPAAPAQIPTFAQVLDVLPKDEAGDPDIGLMMEGLSEFGAKAWGGLTPEQKTTLFRRFAPVVEQAAAEAGPVVEKIAEAVASGDIAGAVQQAAEAISQSPYDQYRARRTQLQDAASEASKALQQFPRMPDGRRSDEVKFSPEFRAAKTAYDQAVAQLGALNKQNKEFDKQYQRDYVRERDERRAAIVAAQPQPAPARTDSELRAAFDKMLGTNTKRGQWAETLQIDQAQLDKLVAEGLKDGRLKLTKAGAIRRTGKASASQPVPAASAAIPAAMTAQTTGQPAASVMDLVADTQRKTAYAQETVRAELEKPNPRLVAEKNGVTRVLTKAPGGEGFRITSLREGEPIGHRDYKRDEAGIKEAARDMMQGGLRPPDTATASPAAASIMDRATEVRLERTKSKVARRYGQEIAEASNAAAVKQAVERLNADPKIKKADLAEIVKVLIGRSAKGKTKAALIAEIEAVAGRRLAKKPAAAVATPAPSAPAPVPAAPAAPAPQAALTVVTPDGSMEVQATPQLVEITDLISASGTLQPRDRTRAEAMAAVREIATRLDPEQLLPARVSDTGAPIVAADGTVISGNGRIMALQEVYYNPALADRANAYRAAIGAGAQGMRAPVLIMRLPAGMPRSELERFADLSNRSRIAAMSATERAIRDARAVGPEVMGLYNGGTFTSPANQEFFRSFTARLPASERGAFSRNGVLTKEGEDRMSAAVLASAYGDPDTLSRMLESTDDNIKSITGAMRDAAGAFIRLKASIAAGEASAKFDITPQVADTAKRIADLRDRGISPRMFLDQMDAFTQIDPIVESLLVAFYNDNLSRQLGREKLTEILVRYAEEAAKHKGDGLFEDTTSPRDIVTVARGRALESERLAAGQGNLFDRSPSPAGGDTAGGRGTGPGPANDGRGRDAGGQAAAAGGLTDAPSRDPGLERDWRDGPPQDGLGQADVPASGGPDAGGAGQGDAASATDGQADGGGSLLDGDAAPVGERGDSAVQGGAPGVDGSPAGGRGRERGGAAGVEGLPPDRVRPEALREAAANTARVTSDAEKQRAADDTIPFVANDLENIRESLPLLNAANQADVAKAEARFSQPDKFGFLFTNGTGTGKTFLGLGVIKRFEKQGKGNVLILAPSQGILDGWIKSGQMMNIDVTRLDDTKSAGEGVVATTYANLRDNSELVKRRWDLIIADEAHSLSQNQSGNPSDALQAFRGLTNHSPATRARLMLAPMWAEIERVEAGNKAFDTDQFGNVREMKDEYFRRLNELTDQYKAEPRTTRALFLSATPFAYRKSTDWAEGFLFDYPADSNRYGTPGGRDAFLVQNFGYNFRYNRAEEPGPEVNTAVLEREFYERMKREGALSGRRLEVDADYDRRFVLVDDAVGSKIDQAMDWLSTQDGGRYRPLFDKFQEKFNYLSQRRLLEAIKAQHVIPRIRKDLELGRKVVVFHDYNEGGGLNPFEAPDNPNERVRVAYGEKAPTIGELYYEFIRANPYVRNLNFAQFTSPIETLTKAFGKRAAVYNGRVPNKQRAKARDEFNRDGSGLDVIIVQSAAGEAGISLHDTTGKHQRILYNLGLPTRPTTAIQQEGRIYREGQVSDAILRYMSTGTGWERRAFAQTIAERASTAENLALGEEARALRDGFIDAFNEADAIEQGPDEGKGSKARDRSRGSQVTPFERAKAFYFGQLRTKGRRDQREGVDYYATPEPIGFKMVEFADIRLGEKVLEPSAGHGAIARWFPEGANRVLIEPSSTLASRAGLSSPGANVIQGMFEDHYIGNKYDAIVMNPPFGSGGKDAFEHLQKAVGHLRSGGRIVAIVPRGGMADRRYETFRDADSNKNVYVALDVELPSVMFERAGTSVATRMIVLEKHDTPDTAPNPLYRDLSDAETITELFNRIEGLSLSERRRGGQERAPTTPVASPTPVAATPASQTVPAPTPNLTASAEALGAEAFRRGALAVPAQDRALMDLIRGVQGTMGSSLPILDAWTKGWFAAQAASGTSTVAASAPPTPQAAPAAPGLKVSFKLAETVHGKTGEDLFVASIATFVPRETYEKLRTIAKRHGGYYSTFRGRGAIPGFQFSDEDARAAFLQEVAGPKEAEAPPARQAAPVIEEDGKALQDIVNPIDPNASPDEKLQQIAALTAVNKPLLDAQLKAMDAALGTTSNANIKKPETILSKASRPSILAEKPWHGVEHIRDTLRFQTKISSFEQIEQAAEAMLGQGYSIVKIDTKKMLAPKEWGWRFAGFDLRAPNGQLIEWYIIFDTMYVAKKEGHLIFEKWRNETAEAKQERAQEYEADIEKSYALYKRAFETGLQNSGYSDLEAASADISKLSASLPVTAAKFAAMSSGLGSGVAMPSLTGTQSSSVPGLNSPPTGSPITQALPEPSSDASTKGSLSGIGFPSSSNPNYIGSSPGQNNPGATEGRVTPALPDSEGGIQAAIRSADEIAKAKRAYEFIRKQVLAGKRVPISGDVTNAFLDAAWPHSDLVPSGAQVAALSALRPPTAAEKVVSPWADVVGEFRSLDGTILTTALSLDKIDGYRGGYDRRNGAIVFFGLSRADVDGLTETVVRSRVAHEAVHAVWKSLPRSAKSRLVRHANVLGVLDMQLGTVLQAVGERRIGNRQEQETLRDLYAKQYAGDFDAKDRIDQESVAHLRELAAAGFFMDAELSAISADMALLDNVQEGVSPEERPMALQAAIQSSQDRASLADHFGATRIEDIGPNDPHPGRVLAFHGTGGAFDRLDPEKTSFGVHFGTGDQANYVIDAVDNRAPRRVYPAVIDIRNPVTLPDIGTWGEHQVALELQDIDPVRFGGLGDLVLKIWKDGNNSDYASDLAKETVRIAMEDAGYDAIRYYNRFEGDGWSYIVWEPGRVVSATSGEMLMALGSGDVAEIDAAIGASMRRSLDDLGYYSQALEAARSIQAKGTPEQMLAQLKKAGVKDSEIEATGLRGILDGKKSVTRDEIIKHLEDGRIGLTEASYQRGDAAADVARVTSERVAEWEASALEEAEFEWDRRDDDDIERSADRWRDFAEENGLAIDDDAFSDDPVKALQDAGIKFKSGIVPFWRETDRFTFGTTPDGKSAVYNPNSGFEWNPDGTAAYVSALESEAREYIQSNIINADPHNVRDSIRRDVEAEYDDHDPTKWSNYSLDPSNPTYRETVLHLPETKSGTFRSGHFPEPNIIGHMMTSMTTHQGRPVFTIDQIQSDWGQKIRDGGMRDEAKIAQLKETLAKIAAVRTAAQAKAFMAEADDLSVEDIEEMYGFSNELDYVAHVQNTERRLVAELRTVETAPTGNHPLVNTTDQWVNTTLRRAIRQAAEANADFIAIPTGKTVESYNPQGDSGGNAIFYEKIAPKNLRNLLSKIDKASPAPQRIETLDSPSGKTGLGKGFALFPLTDAVKQSVVEDGQPLFALSGGLPRDLDMSPEARKARAREMGFDTDNVWLHGTTKPGFDAFDNARLGDATGASNTALGHFFTNEPDLADLYSGRRGAIVPTYLRLRKPYEIRANPDGLDGPDPSAAINETVAKDVGKRISQLTQDDFAAWREELQARGYDGVTVTLADGSNEPIRSAVVFDPSNIRSVNADFDPSQSDSSNLMFALSGGLPRDGEVAGARPSIDPGEIKRFLGKAEYDYQLSPAAVVEPDPYGGFSEMAANLPDDVNARFQVHGMTATQNMARGVAGDLIDLLENGIDPSRGFNSGPPKGGTFGVDTTRTNAPFLILSEPGKMIPETGIKYVVLNGPAAALKFKLSVAYPGVDFLTVTEADQFMRTGALPPKSTMQVGARQPTPPGIAKTAEADADEGGASPSLNAVIQKLKESLNVVPTQTLLGVTIKAEDGSQVRLNPRKNVRGQMVASNAAVGVRKSRQIDVIAHEMAHTLEVTLGADILDFQQQNAAMLEAFAPGLTPSEQFADWFSYYITSGPGARAITPSLVGAFEDVIEANAPEMLEGIHEAQALYSDWLARSTPDELASDVVSTYAGNSWTDLAGGDRSLSETIPGKMAGAYTAIIDDLSPVQHMVRRLLQTADRNGVTDEAGRPISLAVADNPYKIARMFRGSYATGYSWLKSGIANRGETSIAFPGLSKALETLFGSSDQGAWDQTMYQTAGNYLIAKRAVAEYERMEEKESRLADIDSLIERGGAAGSQARSERGRLQAILERREDARLRSEALMRDRRTALQRAEREVARLQERIQAKKDDVLAAQMARDGALASRRQRDLANLERSSQAALRAASGLLEEFETLSTDVSLLSAEIAQRSEQIGAMDQQIAQIDGAVANLRQEREATAKRGASRPPTKESKQHWLEVIAKTEADPKYARIQPFADEVHQFAHGLLTIRHQAGLVSDEQFQELSKRRNWYVPFQRDMSDASPESVFGGAATKKWSPFKKFDGSDRAIINPLETLASDAYATAQQIAFNDAVNALAGLAERAGPGSASIAQVLTREESAEANETTFKRIKDIALGMGLEEADADRIVHQMEQNFAGQELSLMWSPATKGPVNLPTVPLWRNGERVLVRLTDPEFGTEAFNALSGLGKEMSDWAINFLAVPARLLQMGITTHPTFLPRNLFRDIFDAWIKTGALPVVTQVKGARAMRDPEFLRRYYEAGGIVGGRNVAALTSKEQQYKVLDLSDNRISRGSIMLGAVGGGLLGTLYGGPIGGVIGAAVGGYALRKGEVLKAVEAVETMTRVGVATHAYKRAMEHNPDLTESEAMLEAAFVARDTFDWNRRGSKMLTLTRLVTFLNAQIQGMDAAARKLGGESDRGMMLSRHLGMVWRRENGATLSADEERMLGEAYKTWARVGLYTAGLVTLYALATSGDDEDDKKYQDIRDRTKATHSWLPNIFGVDVRLPKAFEWAVPANVIEAIADKVRGRDPRMWDRIVDSTYEVMAPPLVPQAMTLIVGLSTNAQMEQLAPWLKRLLGRDQENVPSRQVVAENLARLDPESQFDAFTSQLSIDIAKGMAASGVPRDLVPSPKKIDFILRSGGYWGQDIAKGYGIVREGLGFRGREAPRVSDLPVVAGFTGVAARQSKSRDELFGLMAQSGGRLATAAATYKQLIDEEGTPADAERFISRLDPEERVYALLKYYGAPQMIKDHPLERLLSVDRVLSRVRKDIILDRLTPVSKQGRKTVRDFEEKITLSPRKQTEIHEIIERLQQAEAWNTMVLMKRPGWEQKKEIATKPILDELKASDKRVHELFEDRLQSARAREFSDVKQDWPELRGRILRDGLNAF